MDQLREVVKAREAAIAQLSNEQKQAGLMLEAVTMERDRLRHEVVLFVYCTLHVRHGACCTPMHATLVMYYHHCCSVLSLVDSHVSLAVMRTLGALHR